jgi:hypothetical protein
MSGSCHGEYRYLLVAGFSVFGLSDMYNVTQFGLLAAFAFLWAILADLFFAPALMLLLKPLGAEKGQVDKWGERLIEYQKID